MKTPEQYLKDNGITVAATFMPQFQSRNSNHKDPSLNWKVTLIINDQPVLTTDYMQGYGHLPEDRYVPRFDNGRIDSYLDREEIQRACDTGRYRRTVSGKTHPLPQPDPCDVFHALLMDATAMDYASFEDWASSLGLDVNSRKAEREYRACLEIALKLRAAGVDFDAASEAFQDY